MQGGKFSKINNCADWNKDVQGGIFIEINKLCSTIIWETRVQWIQPNCNTSFQGIQEKRCSLCTFLLSNIIFHKLPMYIVISDISNIIKGHKRNFKMSPSYYKDSQCGHEQIRPDFTYAIREIVEKLGRRQIQTCKTSDIVRKSSLCPFRWSTKSRWTH